MNTEPTGSVEAFLQHVVSNLVDYPESVAITEDRGPDTLTFEVIVAQPDLGKVIGKNGRIARALRSVARTISGRDPGRVFVEIVGE